ncbi:MAG: arginine--tRNA ligase, partial [Phycisphaerales bacterium]
MSEVSTQIAGPVEVLEQAFRNAIAAVLGGEYREVDPGIRPSQNPKFGDYQANFAMGLAKQLETDPRKLAVKVAQAARADLADIAEPPEIAGPGFINIRLKDEALVRMLAAMDHDSLGVVPDTDQHAVVIDMCSVNVAKQMHVGHLRSTIIGDALGRIFEQLGRTVHRENHLGDWGLPIAMVLHHLREAGTDLDSLALDELDAAYRAAQHDAEDDPSAMEAAKRTLVKLQQGDKDLVGDWKRLIECTLKALDEALDVLNVKLGRENNRGESSYRDKLPGVVEAFRKANLAKEDAGAIVVAFEGRERPLLIQKSDGGYLYATTDLAAIRVRTHELNADRVIYVVDARQRDHFRDVFDAARLIGWDETPDGITAQLDHIPFGSVLGPDKTPLKTRSGENVTLKSLLDEACQRGADEVRRRAADPKAPTHGLTDDELAHIGRAVGIGAIKYADLSTDLVRDYVFDMNRMITFEGNTGPYLQYAHARICSIFAKADVKPVDVAEATISLTESAERRLALALLKYGGVVVDVARSLEPHRLCTYLYELADTYSTFYEQCPVLKAQTESLRRSRLRL